MNNSQSNYKQFPPAPYCLRHNHTTKKRVSIITGWTIDIPTEQETSFVQVNYISN